MRTKSVDRKPQLENMIVLETGEDASELVAKLQLLLLLMSLMLSMLVILNILGVVL